MNFRGFKKTAEDAKSATFTNQHGHSINIAKKSLSPELLSELGKLPVHKAEGGEISPQYADSNNQRAALKAWYDKEKGKKKVKHYANAGEVTADTDVSQTPAGQAGPSIMDAPDSAQGVPPPKNEPPSSNSVEDLESSDPSPNPSAGLPVSNPADTATPNIPTVTDSEETAPEPAAVPPPPTDPRMYLAQQDLAFQQDLNQGRLTPKTYSDLMFKNPDGSDKSVLGKIGTIFGLLLSGAGSGLSHQPNIAMQMMDNEITRDLEAQKTSTANAQNWYRLNYENQLNRATVKQIGINSTIAMAKLQPELAKINSETGLTAQQAMALASKTPAEVEQAYAASGLSRAEAKAISAKIGPELDKIRAEIGLTEAQQQSVHADADIHSDALSHMQMNRAALHALAEKVKTIPPTLANGQVNPEWQQATQNLAVMASSVDAQNGDLVDRASAQSHLLDLVSNRDQGKGATPAAGAIDYQRFNRLQRVGKLPNGELMGGMSPSDVSEATKEAASVEENRAVMRSALDSFNKLDRSWVGGNLSPHERAAEINALGVTIERQTAGRYNAAAAASEMDGLMPQATDWGETRDVKLHKLTQMFQQNEAGTPTLDRYGLKKAFPMGQPQGQTKMINGVQYQKVQGGWKKVK